MEYTRLGRTGLSVSRTSFGALPIQRIPESESTAILRAAYEAGINFYDTANAYTDSEFKLGQALGDVRRNIIIATKTAPAAPEVMQQHLEQSLKMLRTDYIDIYQLHCAPRVYRPGEEDGVYDWLLQKKKEGAIRHISVTAHRIGVAEEALESGLYDTLQYPFSVIADERELRLAQRARELDIGFIAMKAMAGGLIQHPEVTFAFLRQYPQVVPIYGIQRMSELNQWLSLENDPPQWNEEMQRLAAALSHGHRDPQCRPHVPFDDPRALSALYYQGVAGQNAQDRKLHQLPPLRGPLPLLSGYPPPAAGSAPLVRKLLPAAPVGAGVKPAALPQAPAKTAPFPREAPAKNRKIKIFQKNLPKQAGICRPDCVLY